jgi:SHS family lactate transporter-like MFS transporter
MQQSLIQEWRGMAKPQRMSVWAAYLGWTLDAFDFFLLVFSFKAISETFGTDIKSVAYASVLTLMMRPVGALVFGWLAEKLGRRPVLVMVVLGFSVLSALSGLAQTLTQLLVIRAIFGFAMGGEWGVGASLAMETIPARLRGPVSGLIQSGYPSGFFLASLAFGLFFDLIGWRGMFFLGLAPALFVLFVRLHVEESPHYAERQGRVIEHPVGAILSNWKLALYLIVLMTLFNTFSHGTQDLYPTFLQKQRHYDTQLTSYIAMAMNAGAITGALILGTWSVRIGRRLTIAVAATLALVALPLGLWAATPLLLALGAFLLQAGVQGAWAMVPAHLNELSPASARALFPGVVYQLGNLLSSYVVAYQAGIAEAHGDNYALVIALFGSGTAILLAIWARLGPEKSTGDLAKA